MIPPREPLDIAVENLRRAAPTGAWAPAYVQNDVRTDDIRIVLDALAALRGELARLQQENKELTEKGKWWEGYARMMAGAADNEKAEAKHWRARAEAAESARSAQQAQIRALVERWRDLADCAERCGENPVAIRPLRVCSDELALLIPETPSEQG